MRGCYASVMGLPMCHVTRLLAKMDLPQRSDVPANCQAFLNYECPVFKEILLGNGLKSLPTFDSQTQETLQSDPNERN